MADKEIIEIKDDWGFWPRLAANLINSLPVAFWFLVTYFLLYMFNTDPVLVGNRDAMLNIVVPSVAYGILSLIAGLALVSWLFPYFSVRTIIKNGSPIEKAGVMIFWGMVALSIGLIIAAGVK